jgi:L-lactate dehydrogenase complex protein LldG
MVEGEGMTEREKILTRIREGLRQRTPGSHHGAESSSPASTANARQWLPPCGESVEEQFETFRKASSDLRTEFHLLSDQAAAQTLLQQMSKTDRWTRLATHKGELTDAVAATPGVSMLRVDEGYDVNDLERCDVGITECDAMVSQTGSILVTSRNAGGRALSVLPPHHIVLARRDQLVRDLPAAFALIKQRYGSNYPSMISFITGPSRTGDIERILVLGAHGPKRLTVLCW